MAQDYSDEYATLGDRIANAREALGLTPGQLARRLGVKTATVANWEADRAEPRANKLQMMAGVLNVSLVWLMSGEGDGGPVEGESENEAAETEALLSELRALREEQLRLAARAARLEKRLRASLAA